MRTRRTGIALIGLALVVLLGACATNNLADYRIEGESLALAVHVAPDARVEADYFVTVHADDPVATIISIGTSIAKADEVRDAQRRMDRALRYLHVERILEDEVSDYFGRVMHVVAPNSRERATYRLTITVREYGIESRGHASSVEFVLRGHAELYDSFSGRLVWERGFRRSEMVGPSLFGLPAVAGNVWSAALLSELSEDEIADGIERVTRDTAWQIARDFDRDLSRSRR